MSAYRDAIEQTTRTIDSRSKYFRNLIVVVAALSLASIGWAAVTCGLSPLVALLLLIPTCGVFFFVDGKVLNDWRFRLIDAWIRKDIDFRGLCDAIHAIPRLPQDTVRSMLATLPTAKDLVAEQGISSSTREAVAAAVVGVHACQSDIVALKAAGAAIVSGSVVIAVGCRRWEPLLGCLALVLLPVVGNWLRRRRVAALKERTCAARAKPDFSNQGYLQLVACLQWDPIWGLEKDGLLN